MTSVGRRQHWGASSAPGRAHSYHLSVVNAMLFLG